MVPPVALLFALAQSHFAADVPRLEPWTANELLLPDRNLVTRLLSAGDVDGDGVEDLVLSRAVMRECSFERAYCGIDLLSGAGDSIGSAVVERGAVAVDVAWAGEQDDGYRLHVYFEAWDDAPRVELRSLDGNRTLWSLRETPIPLDHVQGTARLLPLHDGSGPPDVVIGTTFGLLAKLSGQDGSTLWVHDAIRRHPGHGDLVEPAGDVDGDGVTDVIVCVSRASPTHEDPARRLPHLEYLSGADGSVLRMRALEPERVSSFRAVSDLDGDGRPDFALRTTEQAYGEGEPLWCILSSSVEPVRLLADQEVLWCTSWRGQGGRAEILAGVRDRSNDVRSLQLVGPAGARRLADYPAELSRTVQQVVCGDFDGDGVTDLVVLDRLGRRPMGYRHRLRLLPGASLR